MVVNLILAAFIIVSSLGVYSYFNKVTGQKDDNYIEERIEDLIEAETGSHIDLTPDSSEEKVDQNH